MEEFIEFIKTNNWRFNSKSFFNYHLTLTQNFNAAEIQIHYSHETMDEYNCLFSITVLFWSICFSWNNRWFKPKK